MHTNPHRPRTLAEADAYSRPRVATIEHPIPEPEKLWTKHVFRATFVEFAHRYDPVTMRQSRTAILKDIYMDGEILTLNWTVDAPPTFGRLCTKPGAVIEFEAKFARTGPEVRRRGCPLLRAPFLPVKSGNKKGKVRVCS